MTPIMKPIRNFIIGVVVTVMSIALAALIGLFGSVRLFGLVALGVLAICLFPFIELAALWLRVNVSKPLGNVFALAGLIILASTVFQFKFPGMFRLGGAGIDSMNRASEMQALLLETPQVVPCAYPWVIGEGDHSRSRYWWSPKDDPLVCYDRPGKHPKYGTELAAINGSIVDLIETQRSRPSPSPIIMAVAMPSPTPTPEPSPTPSPSPTPTTEVALSEEGGVIPPHLPPQ